MDPHRSFLFFIWLGMMCVLVVGVIVIWNGFQSDCTKSTWEEICRQTRPPEECIILCMSYFPISFIFHLAILIVLEFLLFRIGRYLRKQVEN